MVPRRLTTRECLKFEYATCGVEDTITEVGNQEMFEVQTRHKRKRPSQMQSRCALRVDYRHGDLLISGSV